MTVLWRIRAPERLAPGCREEVPAEEGRRGRREQRRRKKKEKKTRGWTVDG